MTDNETKKALECCCKGDKKDCFECPLQNSWDCHKELRKDALDLINRQQAEIENVNVYCENLEISQNHLLNKLATARKTAKTEAIKEFAEFVKMEFYKEFDELIPSIMADKIDNLVKEMTESVNYGSSKMEQ